MVLEDDDSFKQQETLDPPGDEGGGGRGWAIWLAVVIAWLVWCAVCFLIFRDRVFTAVEESGVPVLLAEMRAAEESAAAVSRTLSLSHVRADGTLGNYMTEVARFGSDSKHDAIEGLLSGRSEEALADGAVNLVPPDTELIGLTASQGICYVDLSSEALGGTSWKGVDGFDQMRQTLMAFDDVEEVVFLIDGEEMSEALD